MKPPIYVSLFLMILLFVPNLWAQEFVIVKRNTKFFPTASGTKSFSRASDEKGFLTLELLEEKDKRVQVRVAPEKNPSCYSPTPISAELRLWVNRTSLEKLTIQPISRTFTDGSEVEIAAGMVVKNGKVLTKTSSLKIRIPKDKIGFSFQKRYLELRIPKRSVPLISVKGIKYDGNKYFKKTVFRDVENIGKFAQVSDKCVRVRGRLDAKKIRYDTFDQATELIDITDKKDSTTTEKPIFVGGVQKGELEKEQKLDDMVVSVHGMKPVDKYAWAGLNAKMKVRKMEGLNVEVMEKALKKVKHFKFCYESALYRNPTLEGTITIQVKIRANGSVKSGTLIQSSMFNSRIERCLSRKIRKAHFPASGIETTVNLPLKFWSEKK